MKIKRLCESCSHESVCDMRKIPKADGFTCVYYKNYYELDAMYQKGYEQGKSDAVVHGCWIDKSESGKRQDWPPECSACHKRSNAGYSDFCHNCGAQMDADHLREDTKMMDGTKGESK